MSNYYVAIDKDGNYVLAHAGEWGHHKYIRKEGNRYIYPEDLKNSSGNRNKSTGTAPTKSNNAGNAIGIGTYIPKASFNQRASVKIAASNMRRAVGGTGDQRRGGNYALQSRHEIGKAMRSAQLKKEVAANESARSAAKAVNSAMTGKTVASRFMSKSIKAASNAALIAKETVKALFNKIGLEIRSSITMARLKSISKGRG